MMADLGLESAHEKYKNSDESECMSHECGWERCRCIKLVAGVSDCETVLEEVFKSLM